MNNAMIEIVDKISNAKDISNFVIMPPPKKIG